MLEIKSPDYAYGILAIAKQEATVFERSNDEHKCLWFPTTTLAKRNPKSETFLGVQQTKNDSLLSTPWCWTSVFGACVALTLGISFVKDHQCLLLLYLRTALSRLTSWENPRFPSLSPRWRKWRSEMTADVSDNVWFAYFGSSSLSESHVAPSPSSCSGIHHRHHYLLRKCIVIKTEWSWPKWPLRANLAI